MLAAGYGVYLGLLGATALFGLHVAVLVALLLIRRLPRALQLVCELGYGFANPLIYLLIFEPHGAFRSRHAIDAWLDTVAWVLFVGIWGTRLLMPRAAEASVTVRMRISRLCILGLLCLCVFALMDLTRVWVPGVFGNAPFFGNQLLRGFWLLAGLGPLYLIPFVLLNRYRARLAHQVDGAGFLLLPRAVARSLAIVMAALGLITIAMTWYRPSEVATRARIDALRPAIAEAAIMHRVDPALVAAIVYVTQREQIGPFRDHIERFTASTFLQDEASHMMLAKPFDVSIGIAQIKPITALTALRLCAAAGRPWQLWSKHLRDLPRLGKEWELGPAAQGVCEPPVAPVPINKPQVVSALMRDAGNVAFAALILALYEQQWRSANPKWDISRRPEILATLYQIGFEKSRPHAAPRSNRFGERVAEVSREPWLQELFAAARMTSR